MNDAGIGKFMSDKEADKQIQAMLDAQNRALVAKEVKVNYLLEDVLANGGEYEYRFERKKYKLSVLTPSDINLIETINNLNETELPRKVPPTYKFHIKTALGNTLFVKAKEHSTAQQIVDCIFGKGRYRVSGSKI